MNHLRNLDIADKQMLKNIAGSFFVKGFSMILSIFTMPAYMRYFEEESVLGIWFTIISLLNWIAFFDLGIGNGLRNKLPEALSHKDFQTAKEYIASAYVMSFLLTFCVFVVFLVVEPHIDWNSILNIDVSRLNNSVLSKSIKIIVIGVLLRMTLSIINNILYALQKSAANNLLSLIGSTLMFIFVLLAPDAGTEKNMIRLSYMNIIAMNLPLVIATIIIFSTTLKEMKPKIRCFVMGKAKIILKLGVVMLWLQFLWIVVSSTQSLLITRLAGAEQVVEYQIYLRLFNAVSSVFSLALTPIWSAVTKAQAENDYQWIKKLNHILQLFFLCILCINVSLVLFLQPLVNLWLREKAITINIYYALLMALFNLLFILHAGNGNISNGLSEFKIQNIFMALGALIIVPVSYIGVRVTGSWIGVVIGTIVALLPYEVIQPIWTARYINKKIKEQHQFVEY